MPQREEAPFCRLCETEHREDELCKGPDGERYDMRIRVGGMHNIHRQPLENTSLAST